MRKNYNGRLRKEKEANGLDGKNENKGKIKFKNNEENKQHKEFHGPFLFKQIVWSYVHHNKCLIKIHDV